MADNNKGLYFLKDKKADIYKSVYVAPDTSWGNPIEHLVAVSPVPLWCYTKQLTQEQLLLLWKVTH